MEINAVKIEEKRRVAKSSILIVFCVFLERYSTAGIASILFVFFNEKIGYDVHASTAAYHSYEFLLYLFPIIGAIIADSWLGRYRTMVCMSIIAVGSLTIAVGVTDAFNIPIKVFSIVGLVILTFGDGCLNILFPTFGAEQYESTEIKNIESFFGLFYFMYNCGSILSRFVSPILRQDVKCFQNDDCFPLVFGLPVILISVVTVLVVIANKYSETSVAKQHAIVMKFKSRKDKNCLTQHEHWLDYSKQKYGSELVWDTRIILKVIVLYLPTTIFWALFYQQGSRWVYQATQMNGDLGFYTVRADQLSILNPLLVIILIPVFEHVLYPLLTKIGIRTALDKALLGGMLGVVSFLVSAIIELQIKNKFLHMTWLLPQYVVMSMGEILLTIPLMNFSYSEAPNDMKSILQAFLYTSAGLGNLIVVVVSGARFIDDQFYEFLLFAGLMFVDMVAFGFIARSYKSLKVNGDKGKQSI